MYVIRDLIIKKKRERENSIMDEFSCVMIVDRRNLQKFRLRYFDIL